MSTCNIWVDWEINAAKNKEWLVKELQKAIHGLNSDNFTEEIVFNIGPLEVHLDRINSEIYIVE